MDEGQLQSDTQHTAQTQPPGGDQPSDQVQLQNPAPAEVLLENSEQKETPVDVQEKADPAAQTQPQAKPLWKPIPPLMPEPYNSVNNGTREQSCQTDETSSSSRGHKTGG